MIKWIKPNVLLYFLYERNNKEEDTFGEKDSDWDVYKQISREAEDSDSEEETLRAQVVST